MSSNKEYQKQYYEKNKKKILARTAEYKKNNKEKVIEHRKNYKDRQKIKNKEYRELHKEELKEYNKQYRIDNREKVNELNSKSIIKNRYGLKISDIKEMAIRQQYRCAICENKFHSNKNMHIDHDHKTGKVRMLLCKKCNNGIGFFDDDTVRIEKAILYIKIFEED